MVNRDSLRKFWQPAIKVLTGASLAQIIPIVSNIFLALAVGAAQFGYFSLWLGFVYLGAVVATLRLENALFIITQGQEREQGLIAVIKISCMAAFGGAIVLFAFVLFMSDALPDLSTSLLAILVPSALLLGLNSLAQAFVVSNGAYNQVNRFRVSQAMAVALAQCLLVLQNPTAMSMAGGFLLGQALCLVYVAHQLSAVLCFRSTNLRTRSFVRRHWRFLVFSLPADGLSSFGALLPVALIGSQYGAAAAGQVALTIRVLAAPVGLLGKAIQDVFKREAVLERKMYGSCRRLYFTILLGLFPIIILFILILTYAGPPSFVLFFGEEWRLAGDMSKTLAPVYAVSLAASPLSYIVYLVERQYVDLIWQAFLVIFVWLSLTQFSSLMNAVSAYAYVYLGMYSIYLLISFKLCGAPTKGVA
ncbi:hypothetical protein N9X51_02425 [Alphaproteobacteria bacterium]|nr:hypothetical protein [Alphaproteobacteria bacterium]